MLRSLVGSEMCIRDSSNATRAPIANPLNSAQPGGSLYHAPKLHPGPCSSVGVQPRTNTDRQTDRQTDRHIDARDHNTFCVVYDSITQNVIVQYVLQYYLLAENAKRIQQCLVQYYTVNASFTKNVISHHHLAKRKNTNYSVPVRHRNNALLWSPYVIGQTIIFSCCGLFFFFLLFFLA